MDMNEEYGKIAEAIRLATEADDKATENLEAMYERQHDEREATVEAMKAAEAKLEELEETWTIMVRERVPMVQANLIAKDNRDKASATEINILHHGAVTASKISFPQINAGTATLGNVRMQTNVQVAPATPVTNLTDAIETYVQSRLRNTDPNAPLVKLSYLKTLWMALLGRV